MNSNTLFYKLVDGKAKSDILFTSFLSAYDFIDVNFFRIGYREVKLDMITRLKIKQEHFDEDFMFSHDIEILAIRKGKGKILMFAICTFDNR